MKVYLGHCYWYVEESLYSVTCLKRLFLLLFLNQAINLSYLRFTSVMVCSWIMYSVLLSLTGLLRVCSIHLLFKVSRTFGQSLYTSPSLTPGFVWFSCALPRCCVHCKHHPMFLKARNTIGFLHSCILYSFYGTLCTGTFP